MSQAHVEEDAAILKQRRGRMVREVAFDGLGKVTR
jgi:hypothetical protein